MHITSSRLFTIFILISSFSRNLVKTEDGSPLFDVNSLSELPLERLLEVRKTFDFDGDYLLLDTDAKGNLTQPENVPEALPLQTKYPKPIHRGEYHYVYHDDHHYKKEDKKNVQNIFQLSVTTLAFLAFGGYLLFLVVHAIKGKNYGYMYDPNTTQVMSALLNAQINRRRRKRRRPTRGPLAYQYQINNNRPNKNSRPLQNNSGYSYGKRGTKSRLKRDNFNESMKDKAYFNENKDVRKFLKFDPEKMYHALIEISEGYAHYHTMDYSRFNKTVSFS